MRRTFTVLGLLATSLASPALAAGSARAAELDPVGHPCVTTLVTAVSAVPQPGAVATVAGGSVTLHGGVVVSYVSGVEGPALALVTVCDF